MRVQSGILASLSQSDVLESLQKRMMNIIFPGDDYKTLLTIHGACDVLVYFSVLMYVVRNPACNINKCLLLLLFLIVSNVCLILILCKEIHCLCLFCLFGPFKVFVYFQF